MLSNRISLGLAAFLLVVSAGMRAQGQDHELAGAALFEPADIRPYDNWAQPKEGLFVTFDGLYWHISPPNKTSIGDPTLTPTVFVGPTLNDSFVEQNSLDTSATSVWKWGDRMELGYVDGHQGFMFTSLSTQSQTSETSASHAFVVFNDPAFGPNGSHYLDTVLAPATVTTPAIIGETPVNFQNIYVQDKSRVEGVEALYLYRPAELPLGGNLEFTAGGRYFELKDQFWVDARGGNLTDSYWNTRSHNEIGGPEIGIRWFQPIGRFGISAESRFTAGVNAQSVDQDGLLASKLTAGQNGAVPLIDGATAYPTLMGATSFTHSTHWIEFSPIVELRVEAHMQLTNIIAVKAGYTGIFVNNVVRAADMVDYTLPTMGITRNLNGNLQQVYMQGLNLSIEFNR
ncbi:MAG: BBP7 family outer membrane beta-barrel protein [Thermoguttaceae bacterium]